MKFSLKQNSGFSLIEILVSVIVLSVGLLGLSGLQIAAIKGTNESHFRNEGSLVMLDTSNRMRSNKKGMNEYLASISDTDINVACATQGIPDCEAENSNCSATDLAQFDLNKMACHAQQKLPSGTLKISKIANAVASCAVAVGITDPYYSLKVGWVESEKLGVDTDMMNKSVNLTCFSLR